MATKRAGIPKPKPKLYFEQLPVELVKAIVKPVEKRPKMSLVVRRSKLAGR
jgi:hypothetical protein